jgi:transposase-like protein
VKTLLYWTRRTTVLQGEQRINEYGPQGKPWPLFRGKPRGIDPQRMKRPRRNHAPAFKAKVALAARKGDKTLTERALQFDGHPNQITQWKTQLLDSRPTLWSRRGVSLTPSAVSRGNPDDGGGVPGGLRSIRRLRTRNRASLGDGDGLPPLTSRR